MIGDDPTPKGNEPMTPEMLARAAQHPHAAIPAADALPGRPVEGRRISFVAWGLAGVTGVALWAIILKLIW
jgi:hypothetical protein